MKKNNKNIHQINQWSNNKLLNQLLNDGFSLMDGKLELSKEDYNKMELHSVLNVLTQLKYSCFLVGTELVGNELLMNDTINEIRRLEKSLATNDDLTDILSKSEIFKIGSVELDSKVLPSLQLFKENTDTKIFEYVFLLKKILTNGQIPLKDYIEKKNADGLKIFSKKILEKTLMPILITIASNSQKTNFPYTFTFDKEYQTKTAYRINLDFKKDSLVLPSVFFDILRDAILNARKYSNIGSDIIVSLEEINKINVLTIKDFGIGIPEKDVQNIIKAGYRGSNVSKHTQGFGLGMTKMFFYVKKHGGTILVKTVLGQGTEFKILLPLFD